MRTTAYQGNDWLGMFATTNNKHTIIPIDSNENFKIAIQENLRTVCIPTTIGNTNLTGSYIAMNSNGLVLPNIATKEEAEHLKKQTGLNVYINKDDHNANGNNIVVNDKGGLVNTHVERKEIEKLSDALGVELVPMKISGYSTVGSSVLANNRGFLLNFRATEEEVKEISGILKVKGGRGTINMGAGFVSVGTIANDHSYVVGNITSAFEMGRIEECLGYLDG